MMKMTTTQDITKKAFHLFNCHLYFTKYILLKPLKINSSFSSNFLFHDFKIMARLLSPTEFGAFKTFYFKCFQRSF